MRPIEILLSITNGLAFFLLAVPLPAAPWLRHLAPVALLVAAVQALVEGPRWQMVPAYLLAALLFLAWLLPAIAPAAAPGRLAAGLAIGLGILALAVSIGLPLLLPVFRLPQPGGPYPIGTLTYHWVDAGRPEIYTADPDDRRQIMVQIWYPAQTGSSSGRAPYVEDARILRPVLRLVGLPPFLLDHLTYVTTHAVPSALVADGEATYPVLLFSHGRSGFRTHNTRQVEELVSHGYVVASIDHPYAAGGVVFPDGRLVTLDPRMAPPGQVGHPPFYNQALPFLAQDAVFALDQLAILNQADPNGILTGRLDLERVGMFGASLGGAIAAEACWLEPRLRACLAMDVFMPPDVVRDGLQQPVMWLSRDVATMEREGWAQADIDETQSTMRAVYETLPGDGYLVLVSGMYHVDFADAPLYVPLGRWLGLNGPIDQEQASRIVNAYSLAFFDHHLKGTPAPLLDGPTEQYPEVLFETRR